jgi:hypothetical protein
LLCFARTVHVAVPEALDDVVARIVKVLDVPGAMPRFRNASTVALDSGAVTAALLVIDEKPAGAVTSIDPSDWFDDPFVIVSVRSVDPPTPTQSGAIAAVNGLFGDGPALPD